MTTARYLGAEAAVGDQQGSPVEDCYLTPQELLAGSQMIHEVVVPVAVLHPGQPAEERGERRVRLRPLRVGTLALISAAAREDASLVPLLIIKESLVTPALSFDQVKQMHAGLVQFLAAAVNRISGLESDSAALKQAAVSAIGAAHLQLARHYGWTPAQVAELTPGQIAVYLSNLPPVDAARSGGTGG